MKKNDLTKTDSHIAGRFDVIFFPSFFFSPFQTVQSEKFLYCNSRYSFDSIPAYVVKSNNIFCQFNSAQSEKDMDFKMAITITNSPFKFENSQASRLFCVPTSTKRDIGRFCHFSDFLILTQYGLWLRQVHERFQTPEIFETFCISSFNSRNLGLRVFRSI